MAKFTVTLVDGRLLNIYAPDDEGAKQQSIHQETTRIAIDAKRGKEILIPASFPFSAVKVKD